MCDDIKNSEQILPQDVKVSFDDVVAFWMTLFPELKNNLDFEKILKNSSELTLHQLEQEYYTKYNNKLDTLFEALSKREYKDSLIDEILNQYRSACKWVYFFRPVIGYYTYNLNNFLDEIEIIDNKHELLKAVIGTMLNSLFEMAYKTLVLETNAAGMDGKLAGESPAERAEYFADVLLRDETCLRNIYEEYAELTRLMKLKVKNICSYVKEIIVNTKNEYDHLTFLFCNGESLGKIKAISFGSGDSHNSGKTVAKLLFTSGRILIYKPRALEIEKGYFNFIRWINAQPISGFKILKAPMVHYINDAGWMEYIEYTHCDNKDQVQHFYSRIGQLLCILYVLNARDFHFENIIACGEQPILIDLETLFNPEILNIEPGNANASETAMRIINNSVKCISLLPTQIVNPKNNKVIEVGGLSHKDRQLSPFKQYYIKDIDSDEIRVESAYGYVEGKDNSPSLNGDRINSANYLNEIKEGFVNTYEWIQENKGLFLEEVKYEFKDMLCRIVYRPTNLYLQLLATSYHPNLLRKKADRKVYLHRIGLVADEREKTILYSELEQMLDSDVPYFSARFNGDWLLNNRLEAIFQLNTGSVFNNIARKTNSLCTEDLKWQLSVINYSYSSNTEACQNRRTKTCFKNDIKNNIDSQAFLHNAKIIGDFILQKSILGTKGGIVDRTWIGSTEVFKDYYDITCIGNDIYGGNSGIALFLASLGLISGEEKFKAAAIESILPVINCMEVNHNLKNVKIGFFSGISGWLYSIFHIGRMLCDSRLIDYVYQKIWLIKNLINTEENCDVLSGLSGSLGAVLSICENTESKITRELLLELCLEIYSKIIEKAKMLSGNKGVIWGNEGFVGYSHGNAGIAAQIARLNRGVKNSSLFDVVNSSLRYERQMFLKQYGNWKTQLNKEGYSNSWCHGAPGVLLCKLQLEEYGFTDSKMKEEIEIAIESVKREGFGKDYCLCHGDMGNLLILNKAARLIADSGLKACCEITLEDIAKNYIDEVILKNQGDRIVDLNLMTGAAGIGYSLLQFYKPGLLPDILSLE